MEEREYGWDEEIQHPDEGEMPILPDGDYPFCVKSFERGRHPGSDNLPPCNMAVVSIEFFDEKSKSRVKVKHRLFLHSKCTGLLAQFFRAIQLRKHGEPLKLNWNAVLGKEGWARLTSRIYKDRKYQDIQRFLDPDEWPTSNNGNKVAKTFQTNNDAF